MNAEPVQVKVVVRRAGLEDLVMVLPDSATMARVRIELGESELPLVHVPSATLVAPDMLLRQLADDKGEVLLEMLPEGAIKAGAAATAGGDAKDKQTIFQRIGTAIFVIGLVTVLYGAWRLYQKYQAWKNGAKTEAVATQPGPPAALLPQPGPPPAMMMGAPMAMAPGGGGFYVART